jgi:hypothetical protein
MFFSTSRLTRGEEMKSEKEGSSSGMFGCWDMMMCQVSTHVSRLFSDCGGVPPGRDYSERNNTNRDIVLISRNVLRELV